MEIRKKEIEELSDKLMDLSNEHDILLKNIIKNKVIATNRNMNKIGQIIDDLLDLVDKIENRRSIK